MRIAGYALAALIPLALLILFVVGYPRVFPVVERDDVHRHRERVEELFVEERYRDAERFAALATRRLPYDPEAWYSLAIARTHTGDAGGAAAAAQQAVSIRQTMGGVPTRLPRYHAPSRLRLARHAEQAGDWAAAAGHLEFARRFLPADPTAVAFSYERLELGARARAVRGDAPERTETPQEWVELDTIRQHRPWESCQLQRVRLGLHANGWTEVEWTWTRDGLLLPPEPLPTRMNEYPAEILARLDGGTVDDAIESIPLVIPGWETTPHLWHEGSRATLEAGDSPAVVIERGGPPGNAMLTTLPVRAEGAMLVAIRLRAEGAPATIAWIAEDMREHESFRDTFEPVPPGEWTWRAAYHPASHHWEASWLQVGLYDAAGTVSIDRVVVLAVPDPPCAR